MEFKPFSVKVAKEIYKLTGISEIYYHFDCMMYRTVQNGKNMFFCFETEQWLVSPDQSSYFLDDALDIQFNL